MNGDYMRAGYMALILTAAMISGNAAGAEQVKITIDRITIEDTVYTPYYHVVTEQDHQQGASQRWIRLGVYFTTEGGWIDELDITQMALKPVNGNDKRVVLSESVHYINLEPGDHYVYVYLHPSYVKRYDISAYDLDSAVIIMMGDVEVARKETSKHSRPGWSADSAEYDYRGYLLNHAETPFWFINYDFKEVIKR